MIIGNSKGFELLELNLPGTITLDKSRRYIGQLHSLPDKEVTHAKASSHLTDSQSRGNSGPFFSKVTSGLINQLAVRTCGTAFRRWRKQSLLQPLAATRREEFERKKWTFRLRQALPVAGKWVCIELPAALLKQRGACKLKYGRPTVKRSIRQKHDDGSGSRLRIEHAIFEQPMSGVDRAAVVDHLRAADTTNFL